MFGVAALITTFGILGALWLGAWAFETRSRLTHQKRLDNLLSHTPTLEQVDEALQKEGTLFLAAADDVPSLRALAERYAGEQAAAVQAAARTHSRTRAYAAGGMVYFIHFDEQGVMRAFSLAVRSRAD